MSCVFHAFSSVHCCLVVTCWERADLLALVCDVCLFVTFPCGILGQVTVLYLIVLIPHLCHLSYFFRSWLIRISTVMEFLLCCCYNKVMLIS